MRDPFRFDDSHPKSVPTKEVERISEDLIFIAMYCHRMGRKYPIAEQAYRT
jgi:hypothetical protein